jgi:hypothetical protein
MFVLEQTDSNTIIFSDEFTLHTSDVSRQNCRILGNENPHAITRYVWGSSKVNVWYSIM